MLSWIKKKGYEGKDPKHCTYKMVTTTLSSFTVVQLRGSGKIGISTVNPPGVWPVFTLPTRGLKLYTLPT